MDPIHFVYWLNGFFEMTDAKQLTPEQITMIRNHIGLVLNKIPPISETTVTHSAVLGGAIPGLGMGSGFVC